MRKKRAGRKEKIAGISEKILASDQLVQEARSEPNTIGS
jgi:hypothetical protein